MPDSCFPLLPGMEESNKELSDGKRNCVIDVPGEWVNVENGLGKLVADLATFKNDVSITSIPDIWAGPKAFEEQLIDGIKEQVDKWRAVLAIIGLRKVLRFNLGVKTIKIPKPNSEEYAKANSFLQVISKMPDKGFAGYDGSDAINLICYGKVPIAMVWPNSVIYPVEKPNIKIDNRFYDGTTYYDPSKKATDKDEKRADNTELSKDLRCILAVWLQN